MKTPTPEVQEAIEIMLSDCNHDCEFRDNYSGRGMYGKATFGIVTDAPAAIVGACVVAAFVEVEGPECDVGEAFNYVPKKCDNMGMRDFIYY